MNKTTNVGSGIRPAADELLLHRRRVEGVAELFHVVVPRLLPLMIMMISAMPMMPTIMPTTITLPDRK